MRCEGNFVPWIPTKDVEADATEDADNDDDDNDDGGCWPRTGFDEGSRPPKKIWM